MQKIYTRTNLDALMNYYSLITAELNKVDSFRLSTDLAKILRDFSYSYKPLRQNNFLPLDIEYVNDQLTEIQWTGLETTMQKHVQRVCANNLGA